MKKIILRIFIVIFIISAVNISPSTVEAATKLKEVNITLNVTAEKSLDTYVVDQVWYPPVGKFTISDSSIVGLKCEYDKKSDQWYNSIIGLRPGKTTILRWHRNNKYIKFNITVKRVELDSITSYYGLVKSEKNEGTKNFYPEATDKAIKEMLKNLKMEQYNSDRERINEISKYLYKNVIITEDNYDTYHDSSAYSALVEKITYCGVNPAAGWSLQTLGFDIKQADLVNLPWYLVKLEGVNYRYDLYRTIRINRFIGSETNNTQYAGEGTYTNDAGETYQGSLYYDDLGEIDNSLAGKYTLDVDNRILTTNYNYNDLGGITIEDERFYTSTKRKTHLPAWLIGIETPQQLMLKGNSIALPNDRLSSTVFSSDESIVKIENNKIIGVKEGIAIVYRYDDTYCDAFYVVVDKKFSSKKLTVNYKQDGKIHSTYKNSDFCSNRKIINENIYQANVVWKGSTLYKLEPALNGGKLRTSYKDGYIKIYVIDKDGNKQEVFDDKAEI